MNEIVTMLKNSPLGKKMKTAKVPKEQTMRVEFKEEQPNEQQMKAIQSLLPPTEEQ